MKPSLKFPRDALTLLMFRACFYAQLPEGVFEPLTDRANIAHFPPVLRIEIGFTSRVSAFVHANFFPHSANVDYRYPITPYRIIEYRSLHFRQVCRPAFEIADATPRLFTFHFHTSRAGPLPHIASGGSTIVRRMMRYRYFCGGFRYFDSYASRAETHTIFRADGCSQSRYSFTLPDRLTIRMAFSQVMARAVFVSSSAMAARTVAMKFPPRSHGAARHECRTAMFLAYLFRSRRRHQCRIPISILEAFE